MNKTDQKVMLCGGGKGSVGKQIGKVWGKDRESGCLGAEECGSCALWLRKHL